MAQQEIIEDNKLIRVEFNIIKKPYNKNNIFSETENYKKVIDEVTLSQLASFGQTMHGTPFLKYDYYKAKINKINKINEKIENQENYYFKVINSKYRP